MDFLKDVIPADKITGMIVLRAHNVVENSQVTKHSVYIMITIFTKDIVL